MSIALDRESNTYVSNYDFSRDLGITLNNGHIYLQSDRYNLGLPEGIHTYHCKLVINHIHSVFQDKSDWREYLSFYANMNLIDYVISEWDYEEELPTYSLDLLNIVKNYAGEKYIYLVDRIIKKASGKTSPPKSIDSDVEFLCFTEDSAYSWAGPYEHNSELGCYARVTDRHRDNTSEVNFDLTETWHYWELPASVRDQSLPLTIGDIDLTDYTLYHMSPAEKKSLFYKLDPQIQNHVLKQRINSLHDHGNYENIEQLTKPYKLYLYGNDDTSYSKYFFSQEEVETELQYLRKMQPLDFTLDIADRKYIFTN